MMRVGLTGGIGTGKSTVADLLAARGAGIVDADVIAREVVEPGGPAYGPAIGRFGRGILLPDGAIDRAALAALVFSDAAALSDLNAITHPVIGARMVEQLALLERRPPAERPAVAVAVIPLLGATHATSLELRAVVVVDCPTNVAIRRLVESRGMGEEDARARVAAQPSRRERLELADYVVDNGSGPEHLEEEVDALWASLTAGQLAGRPHAHHGGNGGGDAGGD